MTLRLARRLLREGVLSRQEIETALVAEARGVCFIRALLEHSPHLHRILERQFAERYGPPLSIIVPHWDWVAQLPSAMCERLLAVPVQMEPPGPLYVAVADPENAHVAAEFRHHLGVQPRLVRADALMLLSTLERFEQSEGVAAPAALPVATARMGSTGKDQSEEMHSRMLGREVPANAPLRRRPLLSVPPARLPSEPPIPLIRRTSGVHQHQSEGRRSKLKTHPGLGEFHPPESNATGAKHRRETGAGLGETSADSSEFDGQVEGVASQTLSGAATRRPTVVPPPFLAEPSMPTVEGFVPLSLVPGRSAAALSVDPNQSQGSRELPAPAIELPSEATVRQQLERTTLTSELAQRLVLFAELVAERVIVFSVRKGAYVAYARSEALLAEATEVSIPTGEPSIIEAACRAGYYFGPLTACSSYQALLEAFRLDATTELYATPVAVGQKPALVVVAAALDNPFTATKWLDSIASVATRALERRLRQSMPPRK